MDNDLKKLIGIVAVAGLLFFITRPKGALKPSSLKAKNLAAPQKSETSQTDYENSIIAIKAMRSAIKDNAPSSTLEDINRQILADYDIKVYQDEKTKKLYTCTRTGEIIAKES